MTTPMETLAEELLKVTLKLANTVKQEESDPNEWINMLEQRQQLMNDINAWLLKGETIGPRPLKYIQEAYVLDNQVISVIKEKQEELQTNLLKINQLRVAGDRYSYSSGPTGYGAFFDTKK
ncbi:MULTISPECIES: hypothetical protein [Brevibacillus]|jgi:hypothetical protein|uniref:hypothetical protein n=1 Tax=Brevibacillus TaxID=55080 RepID=UPI001E5BABF2|nr:MULTISPECIES: hypothetical protein [Bacillales]MDT3417892.1 hypothetical protein [Brevibacillus aydinogluensis]UFJ61943.1 hypothetical protein IRT44_03660 [Anoxybacillus sediminis]